MAKRTQINDYQKIETSTDLNHLVQDKRAGKRANSKKAKRRNRHYVKTLLNHLKEDSNDE